MKLYKVALNLETVVAAKSGEDAIRIAIVDKDNIVGECEDCWSVVGEIHKESDLPKDWSSGSFPYGTANDKHIHHYLESSKDEYINSLEEEIERLNRIIGSMTII